MKRVITSSIWGSRDAYSPADGWTLEDKELHKSIDWARRNYEEYEIADDNFIGTATLYSNDGPVRVRTEFVKYLRSNPIYAPYYRPKDKKPFEGYSGYVGPMYDGRRRNGYAIHDRFESQEMYDILSR